MKIGIDYTAALKQSGGIGRYTRGLITTLAQLDRQNHYTLLATADAPRTTLQTFQAFSNFNYK
ncbi:MAG TPA: glycosyltransferase family 1 protein, partial [Anaerolineae bacterium]|nr:glycosyltransferase family 1 protein [Anaerolineae bacterium]